MEDKKVKAGSVAVGICLFMIAILLVLIVVFFYNVTIEKNNLQLLFQLPTKPLPNPFPRVATLKKPRLFANLLQKSKNSLTNQTLMKPPLPLPFWFLWQPLLYSPL